MTAMRRNSDRRRRVLYYAQQSDGTEGSAAARRELRKLREARRPTALYAERVHRRIQGRWFSLVPIQMRTFAVVAGVSLAITIGMVALHYLAVTWSPLAYREEIARPLRLDRADSFGRWYLAILLAGSAGASLMIYQLRRYRIDDYLGRYRLWRVILLLFLAASIGVSVSLVSWVGSLVDFAFGKRIALAGEDWVRLLVSIGGGIIALRLVAEVYRCRIALVGVLVGIGWMMVPEAAGWNLFVVDSPFRWCMVTSAPLLAATAWWVGLGGYLRSLHREVCEIEAPPTLRQRMGQLHLSIRRKDSTEENEEADNQPNHDAEPDKKSRWWQRSKHPVDRVTEEALPETNSSAETSSEDPDSSPTTTNKRRFGLRLRPQPQATPKTEPEEQSAEPTRESSESEPPPKKRGLGLGGFLKRRKNPEEVGTADDENAATDSISHEDSGPNRSTPHRSDRPAKQTPPAASASSEESLDPDSIDWNGLSKSERRRLRKQLKKKNRAA